MILVDTSVWIDHLRANNQRLVNLLNNEQVIVHPYVIGELALGTLKNREVILGWLSDMPQAKLATDKEVFAFIERNMLYGRGIGYIDACLLASTCLMPGLALWTIDKRLQAAGDQLGLTISASKLN